MTQKTSFEASVLVVNFASQKGFQVMPDFFFLIASLLVLYCLMNYSPCNHDYNVGFFCWVLQ